MTLVTSGQLCLGNAGGIAADRSVQAEFELTNNVCLTAARDAAGLTGNVCLSNFYGLQSAPAFTPLAYAPTGYLFASLPANPESSGLWGAGGFNFSITFPQGETPVPAGDITFANVAGTENASNTVFPITGTADDGSDVGLRITRPFTDGRVTLDFDTSPNGAQQGPHPADAATSQAWTQLDVDIPYTLFDNGAIIPWQFRRGAFLGRNAFLSLDQYAFTYNVNPTSIVNVATGTVTGADGSYTATNPFTGAVTYFQRNGWGPAIMGFGLGLSAFGSGDGFDITGWAGCDDTSMVTGIHINSRADNTAFTAGQAHSVRVFGAGLRPTAPFAILQINNEQYVMRQSRLTGLAITDPQANWVMEQYGSTQEGIPAVSTALQTGTHDAVLAEGS